MDRKLIEYLPPVVRDMREMKAIAAGQQPEFDALWDAIKNAFRDQFIDDATENGLRRWEKILKIFPKGSDPLDARRFRIKAQLSERIPFTLRVLRQKLAILCGEEGFTLEILPEQYRLRVRVALESQSKLEVIGELLNEIKPAALLLDLTLMYNPHAVLARFTHRQLAKYTHKQLREERFRFNRYVELEELPHAQMSRYKHFQLMMEELIP